MRVKKENKKCHKMRGENGYLEGEVLEEVGDTIVAGVLVPAAHVDPHAHGGGLPTIVLAGHTHPVLEHGHPGLGHIQERLREGHSVTGPRSLRGQQASGWADLGGAKSKGEKL